MQAEHRLHSLLNLVAGRWSGVCAVSAYFDLASYIELHMFTSRFQPNTILRSIKLVDTPSPCRYRRIYTGQWKNSTIAIVHHQTHRERQVPQLNLNFKPFPLRKHPFSRFGLSSVSSTSRYYSSPSNVRYTRFAPGAGGRRRIPTFVVILVSGTVSYYLLQ